MLLYMDMLLIKLNIKKSLSLHQPQISSERAAAPPRAAILDVTGGTLMPSAAADIIVVRPDTGWLVRGANFVSLSRITPFEGQPVQGLVDATYVDGVCVFNRHA